LPDGSVAEETTGPGSSKWVPLGAISPFMPVAVMTTEDGAFYGHHGFAHRAIKASVIANLKARKFLRGASTISMQLAKNVFLTREKTLSRKLEEMILTDYLEQVFTKDEILELYLNVIEFGPNIYGIGPAAHYYFGRSAAELNLAECLFLSWVLPAPLKWSNLKSQGQLAEGWQKTIVNLMTIARRYHVISDEELEEGKGELVVFANTGPRPLPRRHSRLDGSGIDGDDGTMQPPDESSN
jgi:membrane peptidoglycan carboxypeptidase